MKIISKDKNIYIFSIIGVVLATFLILAERKSPANEVQMIDANKRATSIYIEGRGEKPPPNYGAEQFVQEHGTFVSAKLSSGEVKTLTLKEVIGWIYSNTEIESDFQYFYNVALSPDKTKVAFSLHGMSWDYLGTWEPVTDILLYVSHGDLGYGDLMWSPDGRYIAYVSGAISGVSVVDIQSKESIFKDLPNRIEIFKNTHSPQWSSDSKQLFLQKQVGETRSSTDPLWITDIDDINPRQMQ